jgi:hypothetical protein
VLALFVYTECEHRAKHIAGSKMNTLFHWGLIITVASLLGCSTSTLQQAKQYCIKHEPDDYTGCVPHYNRYLAAKQQLIQRYRNDKESCQPAAEKDQCAGSGESATVKGSSGSIGMGGGSSAQCQLDPASRNRDYGPNLDYENRAAVKDCMLGRGWDQRQSPRKELNSLAQEFGF